MPAADPHACFQDADDSSAVLRALLNDSSALR
jgi:hypothetical protein